jgi:tripartite-type tricarboxylate transporter receptor subunit TctC
MAWTAEPLRGSAPRRGPTPTPKPVFDKLYNAATGGLRSAAVREAFAKMLFTPVGDTSESAAKKLADEAETYIAIAKKLGIKSE